MAGISCLYFMNLSHGIPIAKLQLKNDDFFNIKNLVTNDAIAGGSYVTTSYTTRPLLAYTHDGGTTWNYPASVISALPVDVSWLASFAGATCSGVNCIAGGYYERLLPSNTVPVSYPLLSISQNAGITWTYPSTITSSLPSNFRAGKFSSTPWCSGSNCIVAGNYLSTSTPALQTPLLASSHDAGLTWNYPSTIISNLPSNFVGEGYFTASTCNATNCYAVGQYQSIIGHNYYPLLSVSQDGGSTWTYPTTIQSNLPSNFDQAGIFNSISCSSTTCVAAGDFVISNPSAPHFPLLAVSQDNGSTWNYSPTISITLPLDFISDAFVKSVSCNVNNCITVGQYSSTKTGSLLYPLLLSSQDGGNTWSSPLTIVHNLPDDFEATGAFNGALCNRNICIAVGTYQSKSRNNQLMPLLASSTDGGTTWIYPPSVIANLSTLPNNILDGEFFNISCNANDCTAEGQYQSKNLGVPFYPLIATSHDAGVTWTYPPTAVSNVPSDYFDHGVLSNGNSSHTLKKK